jgi:hypothetical protein
METTNGTLGSDFGGALLGDDRRTRRAAKLVDALSAKPSATFPRVFSRRSDLEAFYRFVNNPRVSHEALLEAHSEATVARSKAYDKVVVIHDTTEFVLHSGVEGVGRLKGRKTGFLGHVALAVSGDGSKRPLGVAGFLPVVRTGERRGKMTTAQLAKLPVDEKESRRWPDLIEMVEGRYAGQVPVLHVADREADTYPLLSHLVTRGMKFVVRISRDRTVEEATGDLTSLRRSMSDARVIVRRTVPIEGRPARYHDNGLLRTAARTERTAQLAISARQLDLKQPAIWRGKTAPAIRLNVVWVREIDPPKGEEPIDWLLATTEPIHGSEAVEAIVDAYRLRWLIEICHA